MDVLTLSRLDRLSQDVAELREAYESSQRDARYRVTKTQSKEYKLRDTRESITLGTRTSLLLIVQCIKDFGIDITQVVFEI